MTAMNTHEQTLIEAARKCNAGKFSADRLDQAAAITTNLDSNNTYSISYDSHGTASIIKNGRYIHV